MKWKKNIVPCLMLLMLAGSLREAVGGPIIPSSLFYASFVEWNYSKLPKLKGWRETDKMISTVLTENYGQNPAPDGSQILDGTKKQLATWSDLSPQPDDAAGKAIQIIYLAAHQSPIGQWCLADGTILSPERVQSELLGDKKIDRVIFLDACYARSAMPLTGGLPPTQPGAKLIVFASQTNEPTPDEFIYHRSPCDWERLCPHAFQWFKEHKFGGSDERISFMGVLWLEAFLTQPNPPVTLSEWHDMAQTMADLSAKIGRTAPSGSTSRISFH